MYDKQKVERIKTLQTEIDTRVVELNGLLGVTDASPPSPPKRAPQKCSNCGHEGHTARTCTKEKANGSAGAVETGQHSGALAAGEAT